MTLEKIGRYQVKGEIGRGGMATVYQAYDPSFGRDVAIKVLPKEFLHDPLFRARFEREAKVIAAIQHPAILPVYDYGEEDNQPYIVMPYMAGGTLSDKLREGAMPPHKVVQLYNRLAPGLDAAHAKGIVHRDLKPGNILYDQWDNAFISDFGIARISSGSSATLTGGNILGTPAYMSPEQVQGDKEVDGRSDIYAMGVILYQLLSGNAPYQATTPARVMMMHILDPIPQIGAVTSDMPAMLQSVIDRAMAKDPDQRFSKTVEMAEALESVFKSSTAPSLKSLKPAETAPLDAAGATIAAAPKTVQAIPTSDATVQAAPPPPPPPPTSPGLPAAHLTPTPTPSAAAAAPATDRPGVPVWLLAAGGLGFLAVLAIIALFVILPMLNPAVAAATATQPVVAQISPTSAAVLPSPTTEVVAVNTVPPTSAPAEPSATSEPSATPEPTATATPEPSPTPTVPSVLVVGGADKIAITKDNEIWVMNMDGSGLEKITNDGTEKRSLSWIPGTSTLLYLSGKCIKTVEYPSQVNSIIACFDTASVVIDFKVSPDGTKAALSIDREFIYVLNFDLQKLKDANIRFRRDLAPMATCPTLNPYTRNLFKTIHWSSDSKTLAYLFGAAVSGRQVDTVRLIDVSRCYDSDVFSPGTQFPGGFFQPNEYTNDPTLGSWTWDGEVLFAMTGKSPLYTGYGDIYVFNHENNRSDVDLNPIDGKCCYTSVRFSPDGRYLLFLYRDIGTDNSVSMYLISYSSIGSGETYLPIMLPEGFLDRRSQPEIALRPALP